MAISAVAVGGKITAAIINSIIKAVNAIALNGIVPSSVSGTGVSVTPNGKIVVAGATSVIINGVFSGTYDNYRITWNSSGRSSNASLQLQLTASATAAAANYDYVKGYDQGTARSVSSSSSAGSVPLDQGVASGQRSDGVIDLYGPALAQGTTATVQSTVLASSALTSCQISFANETSASYDGLNLFLLGGTATWSGVIRVYGYNTLT